MTRVNSDNVGGGESLPATAAIRLELLVPGKPADKRRERDKATAEQIQAYLHRDHPFSVSQNGPGPGSRASI
jgi:hypothetical protein